MTINNNAPTTRLPGSETAQQPTFTNRSVHRHLYDLEERLQERLYWLQKRLAATEKKVDRLLAERQAQKKQQNVVFVLLTAFALFFYLSVLRPTQQPKPTQQPQQPAAPTLNLPPLSFWRNPAAPKRLTAFFGDAALSRTPAKGQTVGGKGKDYPISDDYRVRMVHPATGERSPPACAGKSLEEVDAQKITGCIAHRGVDVATPIGTPLFAIASPSSVARVECIQQPPWGTYGQMTSPSLPHWTFIAHHLNTCKPGVYRAGQSFGTTGTAGTGPHLHFGSKYKGTWLPPPAGFTQWILTGEKP
ncbi:MAG: hypothetical protein SW833_11650 [Cyanobacteriota bacterium]|nr:hypothetical protein [Cyanobacteriota bacterium]